ncbi:hypothetical protein RHMOL_Rhmol09G0015200 [Rhododendron molle]|uniref:Uncharacterized protein n=1 Tax=Rhododendron molle TaxID=49168 RepID=A0ACC0MA00_RHOML|nr:hypothetical protein RHMOL_Rhmol09G0015200 [Rhododendron molle]
MAGRRGAIMVAKLCMMVVLVQAVQDGNGDERANCMPECYFQCMQMRVFTWSECKHVCVHTCTKLVCDALMKLKGGARMETTEKAVEYGLSLTLFR